ncbi:ABC-type Mn2+/Zn2+ transport system permease subunit [Lactovum miscens]|uniref:ABC-type Mn2+/Zn2+ transport system permease subunit n=1 Tax=Lactovum miscens TaxID=190387 RepID=A0A841C6H1_9LACT|nr:ABC-type Mn2+/Zn2+ transport system permease subunit [Lactovum miscens]
MFYALLIIPVGLAYFLLLSPEVKKTLNIFFVLGIVTLFVTLIFSFIFNYHTGLLELLLYLGAVILVIQCIRELEKL